jgi:hypothetical protein
MKVVLFKQQEEAFLGWEEHQSPIIEGYKNERVITGYRTIYEPKFNPNVVGQWAEGSWAQLVSSIPAYLDISERCEDGFPEAFEAARKVREFVKERAEEIEVEDPTGRKRKFFYLSPEDWNEAKELAERLYREIEEAIG